MQDSIEEKLERLPKPTICRMFVHLGSKSTCTRTERSKVGKSKEGHSEKARERFRNSQTRYNVTKDDRLHGVGIKGAMYHARMECICIISFPLWYCTVR